MEEWRSQEQVRPTESNSNVAEASPFLSVFLYM